MKRGKPPPPPTVPYMRTTEDVFPEDESTDQTGDPLFDTVRPHPSPFNLPSSPAPVSRPFVSREPGQAIHPAPLHSTIPQDTIPSIQGASIKEALLSTNAPPPPKGAEHAPRRPPPAIPRRPERSPQRVASVAPADPGLPPPPPVPQQADPKEQGPYRALDGNRKFGRYQLLMEMGQGGMATLYLARLKGPEGFEKLLAIKRIHDHLAKEERFINMFLDEARIAALIQHPNVATIFDLGQLESSYYIAMEYVHGQNLADILRAVLRLRRDLSWHISVRIVADAAAGLHAAHELRLPDGAPLNVVHRDVSPQNILVSYDGHVKLVDFGVAYAAEKLVHTATGTMKGKAAYMSPEQTTGGMLDRRSDIFSLGTVLYECVCLRRLFKEETEAATLLRVSRADVPRPRSVQPNIPQELEDVILRALAKNPDDRPSSAGDFADSLEEVLVEHRQAVKPHQIAKLMEEIFYDKRKIKEKQIQQAMEDEGSRLIKGVAMEPTSGTSLKAQSLDSIEQLRKGKSTMTTVITAAALVAAVAVVALVFWLKPYRSSTTGRKESQASPPVQALKPLPIMNVEQMNPVAPRKSGMVTVKIIVRPTDAEVKVIFRGKEYPGSEFKVVIPRSTKPENIVIKAEGYLLERMVLIPSQDIDIRTLLRPLKASPRDSRKTRTRVRKIRKERKVSRPAEMSPSREIKPMPLPPD